MANLKDEGSVLDSKRSHGMGKKKLFEEMLLKEIPGFVQNCLQVYILLGKN